MSNPVIAGALTLAFCSSLAGCASTQSGSTSTTPSTDFVTEVQALALTACAFVPTADTIAKLWLAESGAAASTEALANLTAQTVCQAYASLISPKQSVKHRQLPKPKANGFVDYGFVVVNGQSVEIVGRPKL